MNPFLLFFKGLSPTTWIMTGMGIFILLLMGMLAFSRVEVSFISEQKKALQLQVDNLTTENATCAKAVKDQNAAIFDVATKTSDMINRMNVVADTIKKSDVRVKTIIDEINKKAVAKDCPGAMSELKLFSKAYADDWNKK